jgi:radical SAM protein with 4Fe4S-binding SPASM domain
MKRPKGEMSNELFHKIIKDGKEMGVYGYSPFFMGEPFIFPRIWEFLDYMQKEKVTVAMYTNGQAIDVERFIQYKNISYLDFSINAATAETHKKIMRGLDFNKVVENYNKALKAPFTIQASFIIVEENKDEVDEFRKMFKKARVGKFVNWAGDKKDPVKRTGKRTPCWVLFHQMMVLWDGTVVPCCVDYEGRQVLGDANKQTLKEIWDNASWMREKHRNYDFDIPICKNCDKNARE